MNNPWPRWVALLDRREAATSLAMCRIVVGYTVAWHLVQMGLTGVAAAVWVDEKFGGLRTVDLTWLEPFGGATPLNVRLLLLLGIASAASLMVGLFTRIASVLAWLSFRILCGLNNHTSGSSDDVLVGVLFILMFSGCGGALSVDRRGQPPAEVPVWPRYVLVGQLVLIYWTTGLQKVSAAWLPFGELDALWYIYQQPTWPRISMDFLAPVFWLTQLGTLVTWCFENAAPLLLLAFWYRSTSDRPGRLRALFNRIDFRSRYLSVGLLLHLGIFLTLEVGPFLGGMLSLYACCFTPHEWSGFFARIRAQFQLRDSAS